MSIPATALANEYPYRIEISSAEYHAHPALGSSDDKKLLESPAHFIDYKKSPNKQTPAMILGTAIHFAILEPDLFKSQYIVAPKFEGTGMKAAKEQWLLENHGKTVISADQYETIQGCVISVYKHAIAKKLLVVGKAEEAFFWKDEETGVACKCKPDFLKDNHIIVDVKTTGIGAGLKSFQRQIADRQYELSAAKYLDGVSAVTGQTYDTFVIIAVETYPPYAVATYVIDEESIAHGRAEYKRALRIYKNATETKQWPAYPEELMSIGLPPWALKTGDEE